MSKEDSKPKTGGGFLSLLPRALVVLGVAVAVFSVYLVQTAQLPSKQFSVKYDEPASLRNLDVNKLAERLAAAVRIKTVSRVRGVVSHPEGFLHLHQLLEDFFPLVHKRLHKEIVSNYSLLYTWTPSAPVTRKPVMLASHLDVVPAADRDFDDWDHEPFGGRIIDGYVYGRGTMDDKLGVLGILEAAEMLLAEGFEPPCVIYFAFGHDEELGGESGAAVIVNMLKERGVTLNYAIDEGGFITQGIMQMVKEPLAMIAVAEKGYVTLELSVKGKGGHSSSPPVGQTPVGILANALARLEANQFAANLDSFNIMRDYVAPHVPLSLRVPLVHQWLFAPLLQFQLLRQSSSAALIRTVISPTMLEASEKENVLPTLAKGTVNFRILLGDSVTSVIDHVRAVINDDRVEVGESPKDLAQNPSPISPSDAPQFTVVQKTIHQILPNVLVSPMVTIGMTDSRYFYAITPNVYRFLPVKLTPTDINRFHGINERVSVDDVRNSVRFYYQLMRNSIDLPADQ